MEFLKRSSKYEPLEIIKLYEYIIAAKSWWDTVDFIAANLVGTYFIAHPQMITSTTTRWMESENIWLQRSCLLFQLRYKAQIDTELLHSFILQLSSSKEYFIRKAIGWALREYSKTNPEFVVNYVNNNNISALSKKEALLWMNKRGML
jgi:3-methyladenine DNA glycosylase AlkD